MALRARDADHLLSCSRALRGADIAHRLVVEGDGPYASQPMALGVEPTSDRGRVRKVLSSLPLV